MEDQKKKKMIQIRQETLKAHNLFIIARFVRITSDKTWCEYWHDGTKAKINTLSNSLILEVWAEVNRNKNGYWQ